MKITLVALVAFASMVLATPAGMETAEMAAHPLEKRMKACNCQTTQSCGCPNGKKCECQPHSLGPKDTPFGCPKNNCHCGADKAFCIPVSSISPCSHIKCFDVRACTYS